VPHEPGAGQQDAVARWATAFDKAAAISGEAGVALYTLGRRDLLDRATAEIVAALKACGAIGPDHVVLELGCGIGRFAQALAGNVRQVVGIDVSEAMLRRGHTACAMLGNVTLLRTGGHDLAMIADRSCDLVLAVDTFPYLVLSGDAIVTQHMRDIARIMRPNGCCVILNFSYGGDLEVDRTRVAELARENGLRVVRNGTRDFADWDGASFVLRRG
jgi:ubiquinone/menaquinone biosynthesis C-methylase UbiE